MHPAPSRRPAPGTYRRRRLAAGLLAVSSLSVAGWGACSVLAGLGGGPASAAGVRPARDTSTTVVVRPGDTLWSIAERALAADTSGDSMPLARYVDELVERNGGTALAPGDVVVLP